MLEGSLDVTLAQRHSRDTGWIRAQRLLTMTPAQTGVVTRLWEQVMRDVHGETFTAAEGRSAFGNMAFAYSRMSDPRCGLLAPAQARRRDAVGRRRRRHPHADLPARARRHGRPAARRAAAVVLPGGAGRAPHRDLRRDHRERPRRRRSTACEAVQTALFDGGDIPAAVAAIGDRNMLTGLPCDDPRPPVAFAAGLERLWGMW